MNLSGRYNIYKNDELVYQSPNLITDNGKSIILQYLAGTINNWASYIGIGAMNTTASTSDSKLYYEISRLPILNSVPTDSSTYFVAASGTAASNSITVSSSTSLSIGYSASGGGLASSITPTITSISGNTVYLSHPVQTTFSGSQVKFKSVKSIRFRSRIEPGYACIIYELGTFNNNRLSAQTSVDAKILTNFDEDVIYGGWSGGITASYAAVSGASYYPRLGSKMLKLNASAGYPASAVFADTSASPISIGNTLSTIGTLNISTNAFSASYDTAKLLIYTSASGASVTVKGQDTTSGLSTNDITFIPKTSVASGGPYVLESQILKGILYNDNLSKIEISASVSSGSVDVYFDSLKLSQTEDLSIYSGMVSRSVLPTPISKSVEETIDIEYELFLFP